jgi:hypothetical protein
VNLACRSAKVNEKITANKIEYGIGRSWNVGVVEKKITTPVPAIQSTMTNQQNTQTGSGAEWSRRSY